MTYTCDLCPSKIILLKASNLQVCSHCEMDLCMTCAIRHAKELKTTYVDVPGMMRKK